MIATAALLSYGEKRADGYPILRKNWSLYVDLTRLNLEVDIGHYSKMITFDGVCMAYNYVSFYVRNAWKSLGNMTREDAMEQYVSILSNSIPEFMQDDKSVSFAYSARRPLVHSVVFFH